MLDALGNLGDFLGGAGVVVTLIYLAAQVRSNTISTRTAIYQAAVTSISDLSRALGLDSNAIRVMAEGNQDRASLDPIERVQFNVLTTSLFRNLENIHFQYVNGAISDDVWTGWAGRIASSLRTPGALSWWSEQKEAFSPSFREFIESGEGVDNPPRLVFSMESPTETERPQP